MSPPHKSGDTWQEHGTLRAISQAEHWNFAPKTHEGTYGANVERRTDAGGIRYMQIIDHPDVNFPGAVGLKIAPQVGWMQDGSWVPIHWLPWKSLGILSYFIPPIPKNPGGTLKQSEHPKYFFTAGINGCSVFAHGSPECPHIAHAGLEGKLDRPSSAFWRSQMDKTMSGYSSNAIQGEIHALDYMFKGGNTEHLAEEYKTFLSSKAKDFQIEIQSPFGCVFGIRNDRTWTLYLQKSVIFCNVRFYKKDALDAKVANLHRTDYFVKGTNTLAKPAPSKVANKHLGPIPIPGTEKEVKIFSTSDRYSKPLQVMEMFPNLKSSNYLEDIFKRI